MRLHRRWFDKRTLQRLEMKVIQAPFLLLGGSGRVARRAFKEFTVTKLQLAYATLPDAFNGMTLTHLSDLHLGINFTPDYQLPELISVCQKLDSDLVCMTGDWIDQEIEFLPRSIPLLDQIKPRLGWVGVLGNHDSHESRWSVIKYLRQWMGPRLLINNSLRLGKGAEAIDVLGLDYCSHGIRLKRGLAALSRRRELPAAFSLGLAHHPDVFDSFLQKCGVDLLLSGHTHGGQISWTKAPHRASGPATGQFQYARGLYEQGGSRLYVSNGLGASVPIRLNCPPEVVQITLVKE